MTKHVKRFEMVTRISSAVAKEASGSNHSETIEPSACIASFSSIVQNGSQDAFDIFLA